VKDISLTDVYGADEMFCTGTMGELAPVRCVDGRKIGSNDIGPITSRLMELFNKLTKMDGENLID